MRRKVALLVAVVAIVLCARFLFKKPVDVTLVVSFGSSAPSLREASLVFTAARDERVAREISLRFDHGASGEERRSLRLLPGDYTLGVRLLDAAGKERNLSRPLRVVDSGNYPITLDN